MIRVRAGENLDQNQVPLDSCDCVSGAHLKYGGPIFIQLIHFITLIEIIFSPVYDINESYTWIIFKVNLKLKCFEN